jgi:hypothetical protein
MRSKLTPQQPKQQTTVWCWQAGSFDGVISVSAVQWLCNADKSSHVPQKRMSKFFTTLYDDVAFSERGKFRVQMFVGCECCVCAY